MMSPQYKIPVSVLVVIHSADLQVLLLERADKPGFWQSVTGSRDLDETDLPTSPVEHLFFGLELRRRRVPNVVSLAPRFVGEFEKGIDFKGDLAAFERQLAVHAAVARFCGPYKISVHSGSDKFSIYPIVGRVCGEHLHVKTAGTSYLEALRTVARVEPGLFGEIATYSRGRFDEDRASYHISATPALIAALPPYRGPAEEPVYLDEVTGRQLLDQADYEFKQGQFETAARLALQAHNLGGVQDEARAMLNSIDAEKLKQKQRVAAATLENAKGTFKSKEYQQTFNVLVLVDGNLLSKEAKAEREKSFAQELKQLEERVARDRSLQGFVLLIAKGKLADTLKKRGELLEQKRPAK